jgi:hypothetical protein
MVSDAIHCFDRGSVLFALYPHGPDGPRVVAEISEDALRDIFGACAGAESLVEACVGHLDQIQAAALRRYRSAPSRPVVLGNGDFALPASVETGCAA